MKFGWHDAKNAEVRAKRGFGFEDAVRIFIGRTVECQDDRREYGEPRMIAIGETAGDILTVVYTDRGDTR